MTGSGTTGAAVPIIARVPKIRRGYERREEVTVPDVTAACCQSVVEAS